jgi:hypothetical protein
MSPEVDSSQAVLSYYKAFYNSQEAEILVHRVRQAEEQYSHCHYSNPLFHDLLVASVYPSNPYYTLLLHRKEMKGAEVLIHLL